MGKSERDGGTGLVLVLGCRAELNLMQRKRKKVSKSGVSDEMVDMSESELINIFLSRWFSMIAETRRRRRVVDSFNHAPMIFNHFPASLVAVAPSH
ncbi:hypothetical protein RJT34_31667 [Clitoria ternatea]|uniref:Uncharacterized protein n=1 Tax=Clitoria ternatea TaxID=43366 RepID=A0AAN9EVY0_CLITE